MSKTMGLIAAFILALPAVNFAQQYVGDSGKVKVVIVKDPYTDTRTGAEIVRGPDRLENGGLKDTLQQLGCEIVKIANIRMPAESEREYGEWHRASLTNKVLGQTIYADDLGENFYIGLLSSSKSLVGMLAGLQHLGPERAPIKDSLGKDIVGLVRLGKHKPLRVGLVWIDAKGAFNTPDITLEGNMEGMNVAVAAGVCNTTLRLQAGLDPPLSTLYIVMAGVRDTTPHEQHHIDSTFIEPISVDEIRRLSDNIDVQMKRLSKLTDVIYVHVDLSVLGPAEVPDHPHVAADGPTSAELSACLKTMFQYPKAAALGIASCPDNPQSVTLRAANRLVEGAIQGVKSRKNNAIKN
ncbi:MAG: hypothetical protein GY869_23170 [Planctomycetes bacterium]|nr:hypothetical protein [Planctomycetota bacterium]